MGKSRVHSGPETSRWTPNSKVETTCQIISIHGVSMEHLSAVGLFRKLRTQSIMPHFHAVFNELFTTVNSILNLDQLWIEHLFNESEYYGPDDDKEEDMIILPPIDNLWLQEDERPFQEILTPEEGVLNDLTLPPVALDNQEDLPSLPECTHDDLSEIDEEESDFTPGDGPEPGLKEVLDPTREEQLGRGN
jgi:hypothetical protein